MDRDQAAGGGDGLAVALRQGPSVRATQQELRGRSFRMDLGHQLLVGGHE
jgi:hypothetical protein